MVHCLEVLQRLNKQAVLNHFVSQYERVHLEHHQTCYGVKEMEFIWGEIDCPGIWAWGGKFQDVPPVFLWAKYLVPKQDKTPGWFCYIGPRPRFSNENSAYKS